MTSRRRRHNEARLRDMPANWERFLHRQPELDSLIRMAVGHYQFEAIHPFTDGNGRTGRVHRRRPRLLSIQRLIQRRTERQLDQRTLLEIGRNHHLQLGPTHTRQRGTGEGLR